MYGLTEQLACEIPEGDVDSAGGGNVRDVVVHQRRHLLPVNADVERIFAEEERLEGFDAGSRDGSGCASFADSAESSVGVYADERVSSHVVEGHGLNVSDFDLACERLGEEAQVLKEAAGSECSGGAQEMPTGEERSAHFVPFPIGNSY